MKRFIFLSFLLISFSAFSYAQDTSQLKRQPYKLTVAVDKNSFYQEDIKATPYVLPDSSVQIYPGETIYVEVEKENAVIKKITAVKENINPSKTLVIEFSQTTKKKVHEMMMLKITNPFNERLIYKATMFVLKAKRWVPTDVMPVEPKLDGFETWPDIITSIALGNWAFATK